MRRRSRGTTNAPPPITILKPTLQTAGLALAYEWMPVDQLIGLRLAHEWYREAIEPSDHAPSPLLFGAPLTADQQKTYDRAIKARNLGDSSPMPEERQHAWSTAIRLFEKIWDGRGLPPLEEATQKTDLSPRVRDIQSVLANYNAAFAGSGVRFRITFGAEREFSEGEIALPEKEVTLLVGEPPLKAVLGELPTVARVMAITKDPEGNAYVDADRAMASLPELTAGVYSWISGIGGASGLLKPLGKVATVKTPRVRVPRTAVPSTPAAPRAGKISPADVIHLGAHFNPARFKGSRGGRARLLAEGQTVADYVAACAGAGFPKAKALAFVSLALSEGLLSLAGAAGV